MSLINIINEFVVNDIQKSIKFYKDNFKFEVEETDGSPVIWVRMKKDNMIIMLEDYKEVCNKIDEFPTKTNTSNLIKFKYDNEEEVKQRYIDLVANNVNCFMELKETEYGTVEFGVFDLDKNMIIISN